MIKFFTGLSFLLSLCSAAYAQESSFANLIPQDGFKQIFNPARLEDDGFGRYRISYADNGSLGKKVKMFMPPGVIMMTSRFINNQSGKPKAVWRFASPPVRTAVSVREGENPAVYGAELLRLLQQGTEDIVFSGYEGGLSLTDGGMPVSPVPQRGAYIYIDFFYNSNPSFDTSFFVEKTCYELWYRNARWDSVGNPLANFTHTCELDTIAPVFQGASTSSDGRKVVLTYNEALSSTTASVDRFIVNAGGTVIPISSVVVSGNNVEVTLSRQVTHGQAVTVAYNDPSSANDADSIQDAVGNDASSIPAQTVTNNVPAVSPQPTAEMPILDDRTGETAKFQLYVPPSGGVDLPVVVMLYVPGGGSAFVVNTPNRFVIYDGTQNDNDLILDRIANNASSRVIQVDTGISRSVLRDLQVKAHVFYRDQMWWHRLTTEATQWFATPPAAETPR